MPIIALLLKTGLRAWFGLNELKQTQVYQEAREEGEQQAKLEAIPRLLTLGLTVEQIAQALDLELSTDRLRIPGNISSRCRPRLGNCAILTNFASSLLKKSSDFRKPDCLAM